MKYTPEEIKNMLEGIPQGEWSFEDNEMCIEGVPICTFFTAEDFPCVPINDEPKLEEELKRLKSFIAAASTIIRDLLAEVERYKRKHSKICGEGGCPPGGDCGGDDWTCKNCWAKYWEED